MTPPIKLNFEFYGMVLDEAAYRKAMINALRNLNERAGQAWINAAVRMTPIPTWSGASRATFQKLASELGTSVPIGPIVAKKDRTALGRSVSATSGVWEENGGEVVGFTYETNLRYLHYNEYNLAVKGPPPQPFSNNVRFTPYHFQDRAKDAWELEVKKGKLPEITNYIKARAI